MTPTHHPVRILLAATLAALALSACGSRGPVVEEEETPEPSAHAANAVILPRATYGITAAGLQLTPADDKCDIPASLDQAIQDHLLTPYEFAVPSANADVAGAPTLKIEITDLLQNAGGLYGGPKIVQLRGELHRPDAPTKHFVAQRQMFIYFGLPRSTCGMVGNVTYALGADIARWLQAPQDGAKLGVW